MNEIQNKIRTSKKYALNKSVQINSSIALYKTEPKTVSLK